VPTKSQQTVLAAARAEFAEHGFAGARVHRIAARAGLNKQLIYYYFGSKAGLYDAAVADDAPPSRRALAREAPGTPAPEAVRGALTDLVVELERRPELVALLVDRHASPAAEAAAREWANGAVASIASVVSSGQGLGYFRDDVDPWGVARQAVALCVGQTILRRALPLDRDSLIRAAAETVVRATAW
jgi:TetR/AcrR family transcriptional regulator